MNRKKRDRGHRVLASDTTPRQLGRRAISLLMCLILAAGIAACQETPDVAVRQKEEDRLLQMAAQGTTPAAESTDGGTAAWQGTEAPAASPDQAAEPAVPMSTHVWQAAEPIRSNDGRTTVVFDAVVERPDVRLPLLKVKAELISQALADRAIAVLLNPDTMFPGAQIQQQYEIDHYDQVREALEDKGSHPDDAAAAAAALEDLEKRCSEGLPSFDRAEIARLNPAAQGEALFLGETDGHLNKTLRVVNDTSMQDYDLLFTSFPNQFQLSQVDIVPAADLFGSDLSGDQTNVSAFPASGISLDGVQSWQRIGAWREDTLPATEAAFRQAMERAKTSASADKTSMFTPVDVPKTSLDEAAAAAERIKAALQLDHLQLVRKRPAFIFSQAGQLIPMWHLHFTPAFQGVPFRYERYGITSDGVEFDEMTNTRQPRPWQQEMLDIGYGVDGIVYLAYRSPMSVTETVTEAAQLLPEESIQDIAASMMLLTQLPQDYILAQEIRVTKMTLSLMRVIQRDHPDQGYVLPVWDFYGTKAYVHENHLGERYAIFDADPECSFLTLNAIDGTVINRQKGY